MKKIIIKLFILFFLITISLSIANFFASEESDSDNYLSVITDKHKRLGKMESPKIVFVGDSSLAFGLDAKKIEEELYRPVSNMGLHAALGLEFIFDEIRDNINNGDIVILSFHYYPSDNDINQGVVCHTLDFYPEIEDNVTHGPLDAVRLDVVCKIKRIRRYFLNKWAESHGSIDSAPIANVSTTIFTYAKSSFTEYGDVKDELYANSEIFFKKNLNDMKRISQRKMLMSLNTFDQYTKKQMAKVYFVPPPYPKSKYDYNADLIEDFIDLIKNNTEIEILGNPNDFAYEDNLFFNSDYHLTSFGKKKNTDKIIELLKNEL